MGVRSGRWYTTASSLVIAAVLAGVTFGLPALNRMVPGNRSLSPGSQYEVGDGVQIQVPTGTSLDVGSSRSGTAAGLAYFTTNSGDLRYAVSVDTFVGTLNAAQRRFQRQLTGLPGVHVSDQRAGIETSGGIGGLQGTYTVGIGEHSASGRYGRYAVFLLSHSRVAELAVVGPLELLNQEAHVIDVTFQSVHTEAVR
jgi:hypothetical protein